MRKPVAIFASLALAASFGVPVSAAETDDTTSVLTRYLTATKIQQAALRGVEMEMDIAAKLPKLEKQGRLTVMRRISSLGKITYKALGFSGDNTIKKEVIARYLAAESEAREDGSIGITPENYKFRLKATITENEHRVYVFELAPRKKRVGLFKGELWLDGETGMPVREVGQLVKNPSIFLKKVAFVREYGLQDGVSIPTHIASTVDTRLFGRAELDISFSNFTRPPADELTGESGEEPSSGTDPEPAPPQALPVEGVLPPPPPVSAPVYSEAGRQP